MIAETRLGGLLKSTFLETNGQGVSIPMTHANRLLASIALNKFPLDHEKAFALTRKYLPIAEGLSKTMNLNEFANLKGDLFSLVRAKSEHELMCETADYEVSADEFIAGPVQSNEWTKNKSNWLEAINWLIELSSILRIMPPEHIADIRALQPTSNNWAHLEGYWPMSDRYKTPHQTLSGLQDVLNSLRWSGFAARRVGLIIGDFRIGTHKTHIEFLRSAKEAVGIKGQLVVITPSKKTILNTTTKDKVWDDEHREAVLNANPYVDQLLVADMPERYYSHPERFWQRVWSKIEPDFVFLGEKDHPLQSIYETQSKSLGGILLIDDVPVTARSADLV